MHENPSSGIVRDWHLVHDVLKINCGTIVLGRESCKRNYPNLLTHSLPCWKRMNAIADFSEWGDHPYCETTIAFLQDLFSDGIVRCGFWPPRFPDLMPPKFSFCAITQETWMTVNIIIEQAVAIIDPKNSSEVKKKL